MQQLSWKDKLAQSRLANYDIKSDANKPGAINISPEADGTFYINGYLPGFVIVRLHQVPESGVPLMLQELCVDPNAGWY